MTIYREWRIKADWTRDIATRVEMPQFLQGDTNAVRLTVDMVNDREIIDIMSTYRLMVLTVRPDGQAILDQATWIDANTAEYILPTNALDIPGKCRVHLGLFGLSGERLTHEKALHYWVGDDPGFCDDDAIIGTTDYAILQSLIAAVLAIQNASQLQDIWDGDKLGIKRIDEVDYTYSPNLTGPQGIQGEQGVMGSTGPAGPIGPAGPPGTTTWSGITDKPPLLENFDQNTLSYLHIQNASSASWVVNHNLGKKEISATIYDSTDRQVFGEVQLIDANNVILNFIGAFSGKAYIV